MLSATGLPTSGQRRLREQIFRFATQHPYFAALRPVEQTVLACDFFATLTTDRIIREDVLLARRQDCGISTYYLQWVQQESYCITQTTSPAATLPLERFAYLVPGTPGTLPLYKGGAIPVAVLATLLQLASSNAPCVDSVTFYPRQLIVTGGDSGQDCLLAYTLWGAHQIPVRTLTLCYSRTEIAECGLGRTLLEIQDTLKRFAGDAIPPPPFLCRSCSVRERQAIKAFGAYLPVEREAALLHSWHFSRQLTTPLDIEILLEWAEWERKRINQSPRWQRWSDRLWRWSSGMRRG